MTCNPTMYVGIVRKPGGNIFSCPDGCHMARTEMHGKSRVVRPNLAFARCVQSRSEHIYEPTPGAKTNISAGCAMSLGAMLGLWLQSFVIHVTMWALNIVIFVIVYGRMIEIYLLTSLAPLPVATLSNRELGSMGLSILDSGPTLSRSAQQSVAEWVGFNGQQLNQASTGLLHLAPASALL